jgi:hypothetical protein
MCHCLLPVACCFLLSDSTLDFENSATRTSRQMMDCFDHIHILRTVLTVCPPRKPAKPMLGRACVCHAICTRVRSLTSVVRGRTLHTKGVDSSDVANVHTFMLQDHTPLAWIKIQEAREKPTHSLTQHPPTKRCCVSTFDFRLST